MNADTCHYESMYPTTLYSSSVLPEHFSMSRVIGLGVNRKVRNTGEPIPIFCVGWTQLLFVREGPFTVEENSSIIHFPHLFSIIFMGSDGSPKAKNHFQPFFVC